MPVLENLQPARVMHFFEEISAIPRGSRNTKAISDYCLAFAQARGLECSQDPANNIVIAKPASAGYESAPTIILQGHLDMVCEKTADCPLDMTVDPIRLQTDGTWVWAERTTLGADDGIAVAMALAALDDDALAHPRLEVILTVDEEIGMLGAQVLDPAHIQGRMLLNVDSEVEGILTVSCAAGVRATCHVPVERAEAAGEFVRITIDGLIGGHSGTEIHKGRANANVLMGRLLRRLRRELPIRLVELSGGQADNAIAPKAVAVVLVPEGTAPAAGEIIRVCSQIFAHEYRTADPGLQVYFSREDASALLPLTGPATEKVIDALVLLPNGVQAMSMDIPGLVQTSLNLGVLRLEETEMTATYSVRSCVVSEKEMLCDRIECLAHLLGGSVSYMGDYPAWEYKKESVLRELVADVYEKQNGKKPVIEALHAGLECGVFAGKLPGLDCISFGPNLEEIHTPRERMEVASVERVWNMVCEVLRRAKELKI